ncbi:MAG: RnfABCDGE type electron transport complex subunit G [Anaerotignaceae bacterium]
MKDIVKPALVLLAVTAVAGALLGVVQSITAEPIRISEANAAAAAMQVAFPDADSFEEVTFEPSGTVASVNMAKDASGEKVGFVIVTEPNGFGGKMPTTVGVDLDGVVTGISVTTPSETPGLGALAANTEFTDKFKGLSGEIKVNKDGGQIESITSATITSRAVAGGVTEALTWFAENGGAY